MRKAWRWLCGWVRRRKQVFHELTADEVQERMLEVQAEGRAAAEQELRDAEELCAALSSPPNPLPGAPGSYGSGKRVTMRVGDDVEIPPEPDPTGALALLEKWREEDLAARFDWLPEKGEKVRMWDNPEAEAASEEEDDA